MLPLLYGDYCTMKNFGHFIGHFIGRFNFSQKIKQNTGMVVRE